MIHIHVRRPDGTPSVVVEGFGAITDAIPAAVGDVAITHSTGAIGVPVDKRIARAPAGVRTAPPSRPRPRPPVGLVAAAPALGGNVPAALEDDPHLADGTMARSNGDMVAKARRMAEDGGRRVATVVEAREPLGLGRAERDVAPRGVVDRAGPQE